MERSKRKTSAPDAIEMLMEDHRKVQKMFKQFEKMKNDDDGDEQSRQQLVEQACMELKIHTQLEEEIFYPAAREAIDDSELLDEAEVEHNAAKELIAQLDSGDPGNPMYTAAFTVLGEYVNHHIKEEEKELFPQVKKAKPDTQALASEMQQRKQELQEEMGMEQPEAEDASDEEESEQDVERAGRTAGRSRRPAASK